MNNYRKAKYSFKQDELPAIKKKMLNWLRPFSIFSYFDNNQYQHGPNRFELLLGADAQLIRHEVPEADGNWWMGHLNYDYKNQLFPDLTSRHSARLGFEDCCFFQPKIIAYIPFQQQELHVLTRVDNPEFILNAMLEQPTEFDSVTQAIHWQYRFNQADYLATVTALRTHIAAGDCYEINLCAEAFAQDAVIDPTDVFYRLNEINPAPFASFYRNKDSYLMGASPERFLHKEDRLLTAQPIKGTTKRSPDPDVDKGLKHALQESEKERAENVMIVDLMRNDIAQNCEVASVTVPELFGLYSFPQVHQLISTVQGKLKEGRSVAQIIKSTFPMGSMTGAPKKIVMELIDQYEQSRRELFSGATGYIMPNADMDFNVIIRSLFYHAPSQYLSYQTGGAITYDSVPEAEWEELLLKARALEQLFL